MSSKRVAQVLRLAAELPDQERAELARALVKTLPEPDDFDVEDGTSFTEEWSAEIRRRLHEEPRGEALSFDELRARVDALIARGE
jgi:putative addiction module component (TIGR02574 family)